MTKKMTREQIDAAYDVARHVFGGGMRVGKGASQLADEYGLNLNSARAFIRCYGNLRRRERYTRTLSTSAADAFLERILADDGPDALEAGIASVCAHIEYYEAKNNTTTRALRMVVVRHREQLRQHQVPNSLDAINGRFARDVLASLSLAPQARLDRLALAPKKAPMITVSARVFLRNADVVAEVLSRANGVCEICGRYAPFMRRDGRPYLEVHHRVQLAGGGEDTVENALAACPNCHREAHSGTPLVAP